MHNTQLKQVNDYADSTLTTLNEFTSRVPLQRITIHLHSVSQMINTGLGSVSSSVKLSNKLLSAHETFCKATGRGRPGSADQRTQAAFEYVADAFLYQASWLEQYKTRKETAMTFVSSSIVRRGKYDANLRGIGVQYGDTAG
jgi:hypothetical protein